MALGHLWSLACEMQFYLIAPLIFLLGGKNLARQNLVWGAGLLLLVASGFIGALLDTEGRHKYQFEIAVWPMMLGFCCEHWKDWFRRVPARWFHGIIITSLAAFGVMTLLMLCGLEMKKPVIAIGTFSFVPCFLAYIGNRTLGGPGGRAMTWLGRADLSHLPVATSLSPFAIICRRCGIRLERWQRPALAEPGFAGLNGRSMAPSARMSTTLPTASAR